MAKKTVADVDVKGKRVLMRVDFNVPVENGKITDDRRIVQALPTIKDVINRGGRLILMSHLGRPKKGPEPKFSLKPTVDRLSELLGKPVQFAHDSIGPEVEKQANNLKDGEVLVLENVRFHPEEEKNEPNFARQLARLGDVYVNDAFGTAHREHGSTFGAAQTLAGKPRVIGYLIQKELKFLGEAISNPKRPFVAILGGAKVSDKIEVIKQLLGKADTVLIGGAMAYTFFKARGMPVGRSLVEDDKLDAAKRIEADAKARNVQLLLPVDHVVAEKLEAGVPAEVLAADSAAIGNRMGLDIGPKTIEAYTSAIRDAKTIVWNGPMGVFEIDAFAAGTNAVARAVAAVNGTTIIGGGDSIAAVKKAGIADKITHISTGGGASLEFLGGQTLPGVAALTDK